ncbi:MAG: hypothetical protein NZM43_02450 [Saprospiraceae bacterium]|nr:hypothetical protein [Saprospiraceae bacterium]MDW8483162.1 hypothetical protein [Saprospiraceae bacterium]
MKKAGLLVAFLCFGSVLVFSQKKNVFISEAVLAIAQQAQVDYRALVKKASAKDSEALNNLFEFTRLLDGSISIDHAQTCLELIPVVGDEVFAKALESRSSGLKKHLLNQMSAAQKQTRKEALKKPIQGWAPYTWEALNDREVHIAKPQSAPATNMPAGIDALKTAPMPDGQGTPSPCLSPIAPTDASKGNQLVPAGSRRGNN